VALICQSGGRATKARQELGAASSTRCMSSPAV
jgi:hypothetical protein